MATPRWAVVLLAIVGLAVLMLPGLSLAQPSGGTMRTLAIDQNTSGDHALVAGVSGQRVRVYRFELFCNGANNVILKDSAGTVLRAQQNYAAGAGVIRDAIPNAALPWFTTGVGAGFVLNLSANQQCTGEMTYTQGAP